MERLKSKSNFARTVGEGRFFVQPCIETLYKAATSVAHLTNVSFELLYMGFIWELSSSTPP